MRLTSAAHYGRAMRSLNNASLAKLNDPTTHAALLALHFAPPVPVTPIPLPDHPPPLDIE